MVYTSNTTHSLHLRASTKMLTLSTRVVIYVLLVLKIIFGHPYGGQACKLSSWVKMNQNEVCFETRNNKYGFFITARQGLVAAIKLVYLKGQVSCGGQQHNSRWGCANHPIVKNFPLNVVGTDRNDNILFPNKEFIKHSGNWYWLPFTNPLSSVELVFTDLARPFYFPLFEQMRIWYGEDLAGWTEGDNTGRVCVDVYAKFLV